MPRVRGIAMFGMCCATIAACVAGSSPIGGGNIPPSTHFRVLGTPGTPFSALITDTIASWRLVGVVPVSIAILNDRPPVRLFASKLTADSSLLSLEIEFGDTIVDLASTNAPFGGAVVQTSIGLQAIAPAASPDARFFVKGPPGDFFNGLIEDLNKGFSLGDLAPTLFLFESPDGRVDGIFNSLSSPAGPLQIDLLIDGAVVATAEGEQTVEIRSP